MSHHHPCHPNPVHKSRGPARDLWQALGAWAPPHHFGASLRAQVQCRLREGPGWGLPPISAVPPELPADQGRGRGRGRTRCGGGPGSRAAAAGCGWGELESWPSPRSAPQRGRRCHRVPRSRDAEHDGLGVRVAGWGARDLGERPALRPGR